MAAAALAAASAPATNAGRLSAQRGTRGCPRSAKTWRAAGISRIERVKRDACPLGEWLYTARRSAPRRSNSRQFAASPHPGNGHPDGRPGPSPGPPPSRRFDLRFRPPARTSGSRLLIAFGHLHRPPPLPRQRARKPPPRGRGPPRLPRPPRPRTSSGPSTARRARRLPAGDALDPRWPRSSTDEGRARERCRGAALRVFSRPATNAPTRIRRRSTHACVNQMLDQLIGRQAAAARGPSAPAITVSEPEIAHGVGPGRYDEVKQRVGGRGGVRPSSSSARARPKRSCASATTGDMQHKLLIQQARPSATFFPRKPVPDDRGRGPTSRAHPEKFPEGPPASFRPVGDPDPRPAPRTPSRSSPRATAKAIRGAQAHLRRRELREGSPRRSPEDPGPRPKSGGDLGFFRAPAARWSTRSRDAAFSIAASTR